MALVSPSTAGHSAGHLAGRAAGPQGWPPAASAEPRASPARARRPRRRARTPAAMGKMAGALASVAGAVDAQGAGGRRCARQRHATAYATLFTGQAARPHRTTSAGNTFIGSKMFRRDHSSLPEHALLRPIQLLLVLHRSIRRVEQCRRDFLVLLGTGVVLPAKERAALAREPGLRLVPTPPVFEGVPELINCTRGRSPVTRSCSCLTPT